MLRYLLLLSCFCGCCATNVFGQHQITATSGDSYNNSSGSISFTVGEPVITPHTNTLYILNQGFQQSFNESRIGPSIIPVITPPQDYILNLYPNPATEKITLTKADDEPCQLIITSNEGYIIGKYPNAVGNIFDLSIETLPVGTYYLQVRDIRGNILEVVKFAKSRS